jgi:hypothetical protein
VSARLSERALMTDQKCVTSQGVLSPNKEFKINKNQKTHRIKLQNLKITTKMMGREKSQPNLMVESNTTYLQSQQINQASAQKPDNHTKKPLVLKSPILPKSK